jgi:hypothetical protein
MCTVLLMLGGISLILTKIKEKEQIKDKKCKAIIVRKWEGLSE